MKPSSCRPDYVSVLNNRANIYMRKGEYQKSLADLNEALRLDPKYVFGYKSRALVYDRMEEKSAPTLIAVKLKN